MGVLANAAISRRPQEIGRIPLWLYVPNDGTSSAFAPASADSTLLSESQSQRLAQSAWSKGKQQAPQVWSRQWKRGGFIRLLSGATLEPSTAALGVESWIASLREIHANPTASPAAAKDLTTSDSLSISFSASSRKLGLAVSSARTSRGTRTDNSKPSSSHWKGWAIALRLEFSARKRLALLTNANDCSSWQTWMTPRVSKGSYTLDKGNPDKKRLSLDGEAEAFMRNNIWGTPVTSMLKGGSEAIIRQDGKSRLDRIDYQAENWETPMSSDGFKGGAGGENPDRKTYLPAQTRYWATPRASDGDKGSTGQRFSGGGEPLPAQAGKWPPPDISHQPIVESSFPILLQVHLISDGTTYSRHRRRVLQLYATLTSPKLPDFGKLRGWVKRSTRKRLNPYFVEWLMGWPIGLTGFSKEETEWCRWLERSRGALSQIASAMDEKPDQGSLF